MLLLLWLLLLWLLLLLACFPSKRLIHPGESDTLYANYLFLHTLESHARTTTQTHVYVKYIVCKNLSLALVRETEIVSSTLF